MVTNMVFSQKLCDHNFLHIFSFFLDIFGVFVTKMLQKRLYFTHILRCISVRLLHTWHQKMLLISLNMLQMLQKM